jgi:hypothetical protein
MTITEWQQGPGKETEASFQHWLIGYARTQGWRSTHFRPARTQKGWRTALTGDPGYFDVILTRQGETIEAELKAGKNTPDEDQWAWLLLVASTPGREVYVWYPHHRPFIEQRLRRRPQDNRGQLVLPPYTVDENGRVHVGKEAYRP